MIMHLPKSLQEACECMKNADENTYILSGGTDLIIKLNNDITEDYTVVDLSWLEELKGIKEHNDYISIGAMTRLSEVVESELIKAWAPMLADAADQVGSTQIRNSATIGGNVANAFAGADTIPPLKALDATVILTNSLGSTRELSIEEFISGNRKTNIGTDEILTEVRFKKQDHRGFFYKIGSRSRVTISKLNMAIALDIRDGKIMSSKVVVGALGATAFRSTMIEEYLTGKSIADVNYVDFSSVLKNQVDTAIPTRSSRHYKREAILSIGHSLTKSLHSSMEVSLNV